MINESVNMGRFILVAALGVVLGFLLSSAGPNPDENAQLFASSGAYQLWRLLILAQTTLFAVAAIPLLQAARTLRKAVNIRKHRTEIGISVGVIVLLFWLPAFSGARFEVPTAFGSLRLQLVVLCAFAVSVTGIVILALLKVSFDEFDASDHSGITGFLTIRRHQNLVLTIVGLMITLGVLATGALYSALEQYANAGGEGVTLIGSEVVIAYGGYLTMLLAIGFTPVHMAAAAAGRSFRDRLLGLSEEGDWLQQAAVREDLGKILLPGDSVYGTLQENLVVLSPLIGAIVSVALGA